MIQAIPAGHIFGTAVEDRIQVKYVKPPADPTQIAWEVEIQALRCAKILDQKQTNNQN